MSSLKVRTAVVLSARRVPPANAALVVLDDFEVGVFLTDLSTRHSLLAKSKRFIERPRLKSNSGKMTGGLDGHANVPIDVDAASEAPAQLDRSRDSPVVLEESDDEGNMSMIPDMTADRVVAGNPRKGKRGGGEGGTGADEDDKKDKKKMRTMYEGFNIYGRILCLVVKRRGARTATGAQSGQQIMEQFVSTQAAGDPIFEDD